MFILTYAHLWLVLLSSCNTVIPWIASYSNNVNSLYCNAFWSKSIQYYNENISIPLVNQLYWKIDLKSLPSNRVIFLWTKMHTIWGLIALGQPHFSWNIHKRNSFFQPNWLYLDQNNAQYRQNRWRVWPILTLFCVLYEKWTQNNNNVRFFILYEPVCPDNSILLVGFFDRHPIDTKS